MKLVATPEMVGAPPRPRCGWRDVAASVILCPFRPSKAARRTVGVPLTRAYLIHVLSAVGTVLTILSAIAFVEAGTIHSIRQFTDEALHVLGIFLREFVEHPLPMFLAVFAIELGYAALSLLLMAWGACDEPILASIKHTLRRVWMQSPQILLFSFVAVAAICVAERARAQWDAAHFIEYPQTPIQPAGVKQNTPQWDQYIKDVQAYYEELSRIQGVRRAGQPWYIRNAEPLIAVGCFTLGVCFIGSLLVAVGIRRETTRVERPPHCEYCGYNLTTMPMDARCPECGEAVAASLGPAARPGPPWSAVGDSAGSRWSPTWTAAIFSPTAFGRTLRTIDPGTAHRRFLFLHLPLVFLIGSIAPLLAYRAIEGQFPVSKDREFYFVLPAGGILCVVGVMAMSLKFAAWAGWYFWWKEKRNLLAAAIQATCYLTPFLVAWELCGGAAGILAMWLSNNELFVELVRPVRIHHEVLLWNAWMLFNFIWLAVYIQLVRRIVASTRFANR